MQVISQPLICRKQLPPETLEISHHGYVPDSVAAPQETYSEVVVNNVDLAQLELNLQLFSEVEGLHETAKLCKGDDHTNSNFDAKRCCHSWLIK